MSQLLFIFFPVLFEEEKRIEYVYLRKVINLHLTLGILIEPS